MVMTHALVMLHAASSAMSNQSGVGEMRCARCNQGIAMIAAGPAAKMRRDAPMTFQAPLILLTECVSGGLAANLTGE